jgi:hypothetical protein
MVRFYLFLWLSWLLRVILCTVVSASIMAIVVSAIIALKQGGFTFESHKVTAVGTIFLFWFRIFINLALLFALFRSVKYLFNRCYSGYKFVLKSCVREDGDYLKVVGYGDLIKVWRAWFMLLIWIVAAMMIIAFIFIQFFAKYNSLFEWFSIYMLYGFIALGGYFSFFILPLRVKGLQIRRC